MRPSFARRVAKGPPKEPIHRHEDDALGGDASVVNRYQIHVPDAREDDGFGLRALDLVPVIDVPNLEEFDRVPVPVNECRAS